MPQSTLFDIFGDHHTRQAVKNVTRQPLSITENMGKTYTGPIKPNEPIKKGADFSAGPIKPNVKKAGEPKKSFLSNTGKALQSTPGQARQVFTPRGVNITPLIYNDDNDKSLKDCLEEVQFTRPTIRRDNYKELIDILVPQPEKVDLSPPPSPVLAPAFEHNMELDSSYDDDFITDNFSLDSIPDDIDFKDLY